MLNVSRHMGFVFFPSFVEWQHSCSQRAFRSREMGWSPEGDVELLRDDSDIKVYV